MTDKEITIDVKADTSEAVSEFKKLEAAASAAAAAQLGPAGRSGVRSTEFWLSVASCLLGILVGSGVLGSGSEYERIAGWLLLLLSSAGYGVGRVFVKGKLNGPGK